MATEIKGFASDWSVPAGARTKLGEIFGRKAEVHAKDYGVVGDGVTDDRAALQAAITATPDGGRLFIPPGTYFISGVLTGSGRTISIDAYGARLRISGTHNALTWTGAFGTVHPVSAITATTVTHNGEPVNATRLTTNGTPAMSRGDVVKLVADDWIPGARRGNGTSESRVGEFMVVDSVSGSDITVLGAPREDYTGSPRVAQLLPHSLHIRGLGFESTNPELSSWAMVGLSNLTEPTIRDSIVRSVGGPGFHLTGCYGYTVEQCTIANAVNNTTAGNLGYGVLDNSCDHGRIIGLKARHVRHAYTDDTPRITATTTLTGYGRTHGTQIINGYAQGNSGTAWSTHAASEGVEFINCQAIDCLQGFGLRGRKHYVKGGYSRGGGHGLFILTEEWGSDTWGHTVDGLVIEGAKNIPVYVNQNGPNTPTPGVRELRPHRIKNVRLVAFNGPHAGIRARNTTLELSDVHIIAPATLDTASRLLSFTNSAVSVDGVRFDTTANTTGGVVLFQADGNSKLTARTVRLVNTAGTAARETVVENAEFEGVEILDALYDHRPTTLVTTVTDLSDVIHEYTTRSDGGYSSNALLQTSSVFRHNLRATREDFTVMVQGTSFQEMGALLNGRRRGQVLRVFNVGSASLSIPHGSTPKTAIIGGANFTLPSGGSMTLVWNGSLWQQAADHTVHRAPDGTRYRVRVENGGVVSAVAV